MKTIAEQCRGLGAATLRGWSRRSGVGRYPRSGFRAVGPTLLLTLTLLSLTGCVKEDRGMCPSEGAIDLSLDWSALTEGGTSPDDMRLYFYHDNGSVVAAQCAAPGQIVSLPRGHYRVMVHNADGQAVETRECQSAFEKGEVFVPEVTPPAWASAKGLSQMGSSSTGFSAGESSSTRADGEPFIDRPELFYAMSDLAPDLFVEPGDTVALQVRPESFVRQVRVEAHISGDFESVAECDFSLTGLVQSMRLHDRGHTGSAARTMAPAVRTDGGYVQTFTVLGKYPGVSSAADVHFVLLGGRIKNLEMDITEALAEINTAGTLSVTITLDLEIQDKHELGFEVILKGWTYETGGNLDVDFNE